MTQVRTDKRENCYIYILVGLILLSFLLYNIYESSILFFIGIGMLVFSLFFFDSYQLFLLFVILLPNTAIRIIGESRTIIGYFFLLVEIKFFILTRKATFPLSLLFHIGAAIITCVCYFELSYFPTLLRASVLFIFLYTFFNTDKAKTIDYQKQVIISFVVGLVVNVSFGLLYYKAKGLDIFNGLFGGINNDRNYFSSQLAMGVGICIFFMREKKEIKEFIPFAIMAFILLLGGALSGSRTFLVSLCFVLLQAVIVVFSIKKRTLRMVFLVIGIICVFAVFPLLTNIFDRFKQENALDGNGRLDAWIYFLKLNFSSLFRFLFGNGDALKYVVAKNIPCVEHNTYLQLFSTFGFLGTVPLVCLYVVLAKRVVKNKKFTLSAWLPLCASLICYLMISSLHSDNFNIAIMVGLLTVNVFSRSKYENVCNNNKLY